MTYSHHCVKQMHNRGLTHTMVELVQLFGYQMGDRLILDKKQICQLIEHINAVRKVLIKMYEKGGVAVVEKGDHIITAFQIKERMGRIKIKCQKVG